MKKSILLLGSLALSASLYAQSQGRVGINTPEPDASLHIKKVDLQSLPKGQVQGLLLPELTTAERNTFTNVPEGTMIYNTTKHCIDWYDGTKWQCTDGTKGDIPPTPLALPPTITLNSGKRFIASVYDDNYFPYTAPTGVATWTPFAPDNTTETLVDVQGEVTTTGMEVLIPVTATGDGTLPAYTAATVTVPANKTQDGQGRMLQLSWEAQAYTTDTKYIKATIKAVGGDLNVKKLDINTGVGNDAQGVELAQFTYPATQAGDTQVFTLRAISGIPDRCFGKTTLACVGYGADEEEHNFLYLPVMGPDGKTWLNNNLGADYANINSPHFNPNHQAGALDPITGAPLAHPTADQIKKDWRAYGSLFQWQRNPDGHELINWTGSSSSNGTPRYNNPTNTVSTSWTDAGTNQFIKGANTSSWSWVTETLNNASTQKDLWQTGGATNPCPDGYHVPTHQEQMALHDAITGKSNFTNYSYTNAMWNESVLRLPASGYRLYTDGVRYLQGNNGYFWSNEPINPHDGSWRMFFRGDASGADAGYGHAGGFSVRCLKD